MFEVNDYVLYRHDVCKIVDLKDGYYSLVLVNDSSLKIKVPIDTKFLRKTISRDDVLKLIKKMPDIEPVNVDDKMIDATYKALLDDGSFESLIKIIKTAYLINEDRVSKKKRVREKDASYFKLAEKYLYTEFAVVLGMSFEDTKKYIVEVLNEK